MFHGISTSVPATVPDWLVARFPSLQPTLSFFRKSPNGQDEPNFIHTDRDMGDWTAILYLNPEPPEGDGTMFLTYPGRWCISCSLAHHSGRISSRRMISMARYGGRATGNRRQLVPAKFNRMVLFDAAYFHARAIPENYGEGDNARLIQLIFGTGVDSALYQESDGVTVCVGTTTAIGIAAAASAGAGIASAKIGSNAAQNAAATQSASADKALGLQQQVYGDQKAAQAPYQQLGQQALGRLSAFQPSTAQFNPQNYQGGAPVASPQPQMGTLASMGQQAPPQQMGQSPPTGADGEATGT